MNATARPLLQDGTFAKEMRAYLENLKRQQVNSQEQATKDAMSALKRTGVVAEDGKVKKKIVSWE